MAKMYVGDRIDVIFNGSMLGQRCMSKFCYGVEEMTGNPEQKAAFEALHLDFLIDGHLIQKFLKCTPPDYVMFDVWYQVIAPARWALYRKPALGLIGSFAGAAYTSNIAGVITRRGDLGNRKNVSSLHVPIGTSAQEIGDGYIGQGLSAALQNLAVEIVKPINTTGAVMKLYPVINNGDAANAYTTIIDAFVQPEARTMRRRTVNKGI